MTRIMMKPGLAVVALSLLWGVTEVRAMKIAEAGVPHAVIVVAQDAGAAERHAAAELADFLGQVTGGKFGVVNQTDPNTANLYVGPKAAKLADPDFSTEGLGDEGIVIRTVGNNLILAGGEPRGTLYAVYTFLEDTVGCHWWTPTASTIPHRPTLAVENLNVRYVPKLEYRDTDYPDASEADFSVRNKFNGHHHRLFIDDGFHNVGQDTARGGRKYAYIRSDKWEAHGMWTLMPPEIYFRDHPEWYSLINGKRTAEDLLHSSLCLTNEEMRKEMVKNALLALTWNPQATILSVEQGDDSGPPDHCQCPKCAAVEDEEGSPAGLMIRFVNSVAADIEKQFPHVVISTFAYHYTQKPPKHAKPRPNVIVRLCGIHAAFSKPFSDERNKEIRDDLVGWSKVAGRLYYWDYPVNFNYPLLPHPNLRVLGPNIRFLVAHNVKGVFAEAATIPSAGAEMAALRAWVLAKLYWDPALDGQKLIEEFAQGYYGAAGKHILAYLSVMHDAVQASGDKLDIGSPPTAKFLSFDTLNQSWTHLNAAEATVQNDAALRSRVQVAQLPVRYAFIMNWDELRKQSQAANADWPMPGSLREACERFREDAGRKGLVLSGVPLPAPAQ